MSTLKRISPMLDGFVIGEAVSNHDGIRCYPAIEKETGNKYIIKVISVPASQANLDALLLAGAFADQKAALGYYKDMADEMAEDAALLQRLSRQEGFLAYENWQIVPNDGGFDIYLLGAYHATLERFFDKEYMTHLRAVNLGLDLCAALTECRRRGYLYVDLKPENVAITEDGEYRICDLGFVKLDSLVYASLPEHFRSSYTAPEIKDAYDSLNQTLDTYAVGMILYQAYNNGILPFAGQAPAEALEPPKYADTEMAQIILKACAPDPADRWEDPVQMGQALVSYMQRTAVNDVPIAPLPQEPEVPEEALAESAEETPVNDIMTEADLLLNALEAESTETIVEAPAEEAVEEVPVEEPTEEVVEETPVEVPTEEIVEEVIVEEPAEEIVEEVIVEEPTEEVVEEVIVEEPTEEVVEETPVEDPAEEIVEEVIVEEPTEEVVEEEVVEEETAEEDDIAVILAQADALISHEIPESVVVPEPIVVEIPGPAAEETVPEEITEEPAEEVIGEETIEEPAEEIAVEETAEEPDVAPIILPEEEKPAKQRKKLPAFLAWLPVLVLFVMCLVLGNYIFYNQYYLQTIQNMTLKGFENQLTVTLRSQIDDDLLTVFCSDTNGNTTQSPVVKGKATFENLQPNTRYQVYVVIEGFHKLVGVVEDVYTTPNTTSVTNITGIAGSEDGSVILNFDVVGDDSTEWTVCYQTEGEAEKKLTFKGHMVTVTGLTVGKTYTFRFEPKTKLYMVGDNTFTYTASKVIYAENLFIESAAGGKLVATWEVPDGVTVESWTVYCYNDGGYKKTITVTEPKAVFEGLNFATEYTVEVTAAGMTKSVRTYISPNPITINKVTFDDSDPNKLTISWEYEGNAPESGWLLLYSINSSAATQHITSTASSVTLDTRIPGCTYDVTIQTIDGYTVFNSSYRYQAPEAKTFEGYWLKAKYMKFEMCVPPNSGKWTKADLTKKDYTTSFAIGSKAAFAVTLTEEYNTSPDIIVTLFVIRDAGGNIVLTDNSQSRTWTSMWYKGFGRILVPVLPDTAGQYSMEIYLNGMLVHAQKFEMT